MGQKVGARHGLVRPVHGTEAVPPNLALALTLSVASAGSRCVAYRLVRQYVVEAAVELAKLGGEEALLVGKDARLRLERSARE